MRISLGVLLAGALVSGSLVPAAAAGLAGIEPSSPMAFQEPVPIPIGYYELCVASPSVCRPRAGRLPRTADGAVRATPGLFEKLQSVTAAVNRSISPVADKDAPGMATWRVNAKAGNCKDYALAKRQRLLAEGLPSSAALVAIVRLWSGEQHAVLVVRTDRGDYVLDNLDDAVRPWRRVSYRWEKIQSPTDTWIWFRL
jgi:predicted transglutaminase-like cysteine proteinase